MPEQKDIKLLSAFSRAIDEMTEAAMYVEYDSPEHSQVAQFTYDAMKGKYNELIIASSSNRWIGANELIELVNKLTAK